MIRSIVGASMRFRVLVVGIGVALMVIGVTQLRKMPADVLPEFTPTYVEVQTESLGLSSEEIQQLVTVPLEADLLAGVPKVDLVRSESVPGLSSIVLVFEPGTPILDARQLVAEALTQAHALPNVSTPPTMLQPLSSESRVMMIGVSSPELTPIQRGVLARWTIRPRLMGVPGVANVTIWGQRDRQLQVLVDPRHLRDQGVTLQQVVRTTGNAQLVSPLTFLEASTPGTGGFIDTPNQRLQIRHVLPIVTAKKLAEVPVEDSAGPNGGPLQLRDVAHVVEGHQPLIGDAIVRGGEGPLMVVEKFPGANTLQVTRGVEKALDELRPGLEDVKVDTSLFKPAEFIESAIDNITLAAIVGLALLAVVLLAFIFEWRTALISLAAIALSLVAAALVLDLTGATINAIALAGLVVALGVIVDDAVANVQSIWRRLREQGNGDEANQGAIVDAFVEVRRGIGYGTVAALLVVVPLLLVEGVTGQFFEPLALSYALALAASTLVAVTVTPALSRLLFSKRASGHGEAPLARWLARHYEGVVSRVVKNPGLALVGAAMAVLVGVLGIWGLSGPIIPQFKDRDLLVRIKGAPGTSNPEMTRIARLAVHDIREVPGVQDAGGHVGRSITGDQVVNVNSGELWVSMNSDADYGETADLVRNVVKTFPGINSDVSTYEQQRIRAIASIDGRAAKGAPQRDPDLDLLTGAADTPVVVRVYGDSLNTLRQKAEEIKKVIAGVDGVQNPQVERVPEQPTIEIETDLNSAQKYEIKPGDVRRAAATLLQGLTVGSLFEHQAVFEVTVRGEPATRQNLTEIRNLLIDTPGGGHVRLDDVADVRIRPTPEVIRREAIQPRLDVTADVSGRGIGDVLDDVEKQVKEKVKFPLEYHAEVLRDSTQWESAKTRIIVGAIGIAVVIFLLFQALFGSWRLALAVFASLPVALVGGVLAALIAGGTFSLGSLLGLLAVFGVAARNSAVLVARCQTLERDEGGAFGPELVSRAARERLVPILMSAGALAVLFLPVVLMGDRPGYEILHPMGVAIVGGLVTSTLLSLLAIPALQVRFGSKSAPAETGAASS